MPYLCHTYSLQYKHSTNMKKKCIELLTQSTTFTNTYCTKIQYSTAVLVINLARAQTLTSVILISQLSVPFSYDSQISCTWKSFLVLKYA